MANRGATRPTINDELFSKLWCLIRHESVKAGAQAPTSVTLFDQGLADVLEASVAELQPMQPYVLALSERADGSGKIGAAGRLHNQPGCCGDRQHCRADPPDRPGHRGRAPPLPGHRIRLDDAAGQARTGAGTVTSQMPRVVHIIMAADSITIVRSGYGPEEIIHRFEAEARLGSLPSHLMRVRSNASLAYDF